MTAIFKAHEGCQKPRTVLIEGDPGMGKTTYCQKLAYDWANRQGEWDNSFPEIELLLLLRCHDIESNIWEAIEEQILPEDIDRESKENFFKFIRENQSKVLLVLDGFDEVDPSKLAMYLKLAEGELYIEESKFDCSLTVLSLLTKFGFLSIQVIQGSRRKRCVRYGFMHKSFQEFFSGFYLASKILSRELDCDTVVTDRRYLDELKQACLFMTGIVVSRCEETAVCLVKTIGAHINGQIHLNRSLEFAFDCIEECTTHKKNLESQLLQTFGSHLDIMALHLERDVQWNFEYFCTALTVNTTLKYLNLSSNNIGPSQGAAFLSDAIKFNIPLTHLHLDDNNIGHSGAAFLSDAIRVNTVLTNLHLSVNNIGDSGAGSLSDAINVNNVLSLLK